MNKQDPTNIDVTDLKDKWREFFTAALADNQEMKRTYRDPAAQSFIDQRIEKLQVVLDTLDDCDPEVITKAEVFFSSPDKNRTKFALDMLNARVGRSDFPSPNAEAFIRELTRNLDDYFRPLTKKELIEQLMRVPTHKGYDAPPFPDDTIVEIGFRFSDDAGESLVPIGIVNHVSWVDDRRTPHPKGCRIQLVLIGHEGCQWDQDKLTVTFDYHTAYAAAHKDEDRAKVVDPTDDDIAELISAIKEGLS